MQVQDLCAGTDMYWTAGDGWYCTHTCRRSVYGPDVLPRRHKFMLQSVPSVNVDASQARWCRRSLSLHPLKLHLTDRHCRILTANHGIGEEGFEGCRSDVGDEEETIDVVDWVGRRRGGAVLGGPAEQRWRRWRPASDDGRRRTRGCSHRDDDCRLESMCSTGSGQRQTATSLLPSRLRHARRRQRLPFNAVSNY